MSCLGKALMLKTIIAVFHLSIPPSYHLDSLAQDMYLCYTHTHTHTHTHNPILYEDIYFLVFISVSTFLGQVSALPSEEALWPLSLI